MVSTILAGLVERADIDGVSREHLERMRHIMIQRVANTSMLEDLVMVGATGITIVDG